MSFHDAKVNNTIDEGATLKTLIVMFVLLWVIPNIFEKLLTG